MYVLYYNKECNDCAKLASKTSKLDWLKRINLSTDVGPAGELKLGEIALVDESSSKLYTGGYAQRKICLNIPAYFIFGLLLYFPPFLKLVSGKKVGCNGDTCNV